MPPAEKAKPHAPASPAPKAPELPPPPPAPKPGVCREPPYPPISKAVEVWPATFPPPPPRCMLQRQSSSPCPHRRRRRSLTRLRQNRQRPAKQAILPPPPPLPKAANTAALAGMDAGGSPTLLAQGCMSHEQSYRHLTSCLACLLHEIMFDELHVHVCSCEMKGASSCD